MDKKFSQQESRLIVTWLKEKHKVPITNSFFFWRESPSEAAERINARWKDVKVSAADLVRAAGREVVE